MSEMVERVARAIVSETDGAPFQLSLGVALGVARAAIEAMREPTEEMKAVFCSARPETPKTVWHETIDAALK